MALGAFLAGLMLAETEFRHHIEADIEPFRGLLLGLFCMSVGRALNPLALWDQLALVPVLSVGLLLIKAVIIAGVSLLFGTIFGNSLPPGGLHGHAIRVGLTLSQGSEFAFFILGLALAGQLIDPELNQLLIMVVVLTMAVTPFLVALGRRIRDVMLPQSVTPPGPDGFDSGDGGHVVVLGYGRVGAIVSNLLTVSGIRTVALDADPGVVRRARLLEQDVFYGDGTSHAVLKHAGIKSARAVVVSLTNLRVAEQAVAVLRRDFPRLPIYARAVDQVHAASLRDAGAERVVPEMVQTSVELGSLLLKEVYYKKPEYLDWADKMGAYGVALQDSKTKN